MKFLLDLLPVILFFATFKWGGQHSEALAAWMTQHAGHVTLTGSIQASQAPILAATAVTMLVSLVQIVWQRMAGKRVETMQWVTLVLIVSLGSATLFFNDERFIKWKPTAVYWLLGGALLFWQLVLRKNALQALMGSQLKLPDVIFARLSYAWAVFFLLMGVINLWVAFSFSTDVWVDFKLFGTLGATIVFVIAQSFYLARYMEPVAEAGDDTDAMDGTKTGNVDETQR